MTFYINNPTRQAAFHGNHTGKRFRFIEILYLLRICILDMNRNGLTHWNSVYPGPDIILDDLANLHIPCKRQKESAREWWRLTTRNLRNTRVYNGQQGTEATFCASAGCASQLAGQGLRENWWRLPKNSPWRTDTMRSGLMFSVTACMHGICAGKTILMKQGTFSVFSAAAFCLLR